MANRSMLQQWGQQYLAAAPRGTGSVGTAPARQNNTIASFGGKPVGFFGAPKMVGSNGTATVVAGLGGGAGLAPRGAAPGTVLHGGGQPTVGGLPAGVTTTGSRAPVYASGAGAGVPGTVAPGAATAGGAGSGPMNLTDIIKQYQDQYDAANAKNEDRYNQLLDNAKSDKSETLGAINKGYGGVADLAASQAADVRAKQGSGWDAILALAGQDGTKASVERENRREKSELGQAAQSLTSRGLVGTTVSDSVRRGIVDDSELRRQGIADAQQGREIATRQNMLSQTIPTELRLNEGQQGIGLQQTAANVGAIGNANAGRQGIIERRTDEGPDLGLITQLLQQAGSQQVQQAQLASLQSQLAQGQQQTSQTNQYQQLLNSVLSQYQNSYGGGYPQTLASGFNGGGRNVPNGTAVKYPSAGGFQRPDGSSVFSGVLQAPGYEQHTGVQNVNNGGYNGNPGNYGPGAGLGLGTPAAPGTPLPGGSDGGGVNRAGVGFQPAPAGGLDPDLARWLWEQMNGYAS